MLSRAALVFILILADAALGGSASWAQDAPRSASGAAAARPEDRRNLLRDFQTYYILSDTIFLKREVLLKACEQRLDFAAWNLTAVDDPHEAEVVILITLPFMSWEWNFEMKEGVSGPVIASGKVKALEQRQAAPLLAAEISRQIQSVRGIPRVQANLVSHPGPGQAKQQTWSVKGGPGPFQGRDVTLALGPQSALLTENSAPLLEIPLQHILSAYDFVPQARQRTERIERWDKGWDRACEQTAGGDGCLALFGAPIWLLGDAILRIPGPSTHLVIIRWQDGQNVSEVSLQAKGSDWKDILNGLQAALGKNREGDAALEAERLRKQFEGASHTDLKVFLEATVNIGRWPPLRGPARYRMIVLERDSGRAEVFFYDLGDPRLTRPLAVAVAHFERVPQLVATITATLRETADARLLDQIRYEDVVLQFDSGN